MSSLAFLLFSDFIMVECCNYHSFIILYNIKFTSCCIIYCFNKLLIATMALWFISKKKNFFSSIYKLIHILTKNKYIKEEEIVSHFLILHSAWMDFFFDSNLKNSRTLFYPSGTFISYLHLSENALSSEAYIKSWVMHLCDRKCFHGGNIRKCRSVYVFLAKQNKDAKCLCFLFYYCLIKYCGFDGFFFSLF